MHTTRALGSRYTLLDRSAADDLLPACLERGARIVDAGAFNSGLLARSRPTRDAHYDYAPVAPDVLARAQALADLCALHGRHNRPPLT